MQPVVVRCLVDFLGETHDSGTENTSEIGPPNGSKH